MLPVESVTSIGIVELEKLSKSAFEKLAQLSSSVAEAEVAHSQGLPASVATGAVSAVAQAN